MIRTAVAMGGLNPQFVNHSALGELESDLIGFTLHPKSPLDRHMTLVRAVYLAARRTGLRAILDGVGGDLVFADGGYLPYLVRRGYWRTAVREAHAQHAYWGGGDSPASRLAQEFRAASIPDWARRLRRKLDQPSHRSDSARPDSFICPIFARRIGLSARLSAEEARLRLSFAPGSPERRAARLFDPRIVAARERYEREASRVGIEPRDPFLDLQVASLCFSLPVEQLTRNGWPKFILRRIVAGEMPDEVRWRRGRNHLGWVYSKAVIDSANRREEFLSIEHLERIAPYYDIDRLRTALRAYPDGASLSQPEQEQVYTAAILARWLLRQDEYQK